MELVLRVKLGIIAIIMSSNGENGEDLPLSED